MVCYFYVALQTPGIIFIMSDTHILKGDYTDYILILIGVIKLRDLYLVRKSRRLQSAVEEIF
ncbi:MAG: hypothetical protein A3K22_01570 [Deltaproteobacteria bacterium RBG_16_42_7]|nr:MAG: hypothetical protein A3K22_01570 [Deltaproteobacteria bacterium RBG_16_42_7]